MAIVLGSIAYGTAIYSDLFGISSHLGRLCVMALMTVALIVLPALLLDAKLRESLKTYLRRSAS